MIPRLTHQIWLGGPLPDHLAEYRRTVVDHHPGWEHRLWGDDDFGWLQNQSLFDRADELAPGSEGQFRSDVARYEILRLMGGVYLDLDIEVRAPLDGFLGVECFAGWETDRFANNAVIGATRWHPLYVDLVDRLPASIEANAGKRPNRMTGPHFFTPLAVEHGCTIHPRETFYPYAYDELERADEEFPGAMTVHHWDNQRKLKSVPRG